MTSPVVAEIRTEAIRRNLHAIRRRTPAGTPICAGVKADAYGHGIEQVLPVMVQENIERLAVANLDEALDLRRLGWTRPILCFGSPLAADNDRDRRWLARQAVAAGVNCTVSSVEEAQVLADEAGKLNRQARVEIKIDTGMGRMGVLHDKSVEMIARIARDDGVIVEGVYTHFACANDVDLTFARQQITRFIDLKRRLGTQAVCVGMFHAANSAAIFRLPESHLDMVRPGISVYGYWDGPVGDRPGDLYPAMRVLSRLVAVRRLPAGHAVGYGRTFITKKDSIIGVVPIGYADGYRRLLSNDAVMTLEAVRERTRCTVPVVGRVSMDQTTVNLTDAGDVRVGDSIVIIDDDTNAANSVESLARKLGTIPHEITCLVGQRAGRVEV